MRVSAAGLAFIGRFEGYRARAYNDAAGVATIGYGHVLHYGPVNPRDRLRYWPRAYALSVLRSDAAKAEAGVHTYARPDLTQAQFDALCSFAFNCGVGGLAHSTLLQDVNRKAAGKVIRASFLRWNHAGGVELPGLTTRRKAEASLYLTGRYT